jgi:tRNA threonylcarbamoyladenosine biosynthesis protein TsaE
MFSFQGAGRESVTKAILISHFYDSRDGDIPLRRQGIRVKTFISHSREETIALGERIGAAAPSGAVIAFKGGLGAGKTTLSKGIARGLGIEEEICSPTYTIISEYPGRLLLRHMDAYRLRGDADFEEIGGVELLGVPGSLCLIEWSEKLPESIDADAAVIEIEMSPNGDRRFTLIGGWMEVLIP